MLHSQLMGHKNCEVLDVEYQKVCEELRRELHSQAKLGPITVDSSHPSMDRATELVRRERELRQELVQMKDDNVKEQMMQKQHLINLEGVHDGIKRQMESNLQKRLPSHLMLSSLHDPFQDEAESVSADKLPAAAERFPVGVRVQSRDGMVESLPGEISGKLQFPTK